MALVCDSCDTAASLTRFAGVDRLRLMVDKAKTDFAHPLGVKPKHRKIVRFFGQVSTCSALQQPLASDQTCS